ncbi:hypothetical protein GCM10007036_13910 [Alsobacter metallidurans]|uniref:Uncharacterized protein n=1 Tax=Alsobacter metallidurans TaxID=340221 RepID=A0A917I6D8_9HYPH|nr:siphovirus Gp157 family protein [Alsobacter metallidurans]GGH14531.1 hypothetical protein GCM10007036_13910 [Alsobacter metallidurans]
MAKKPSRAPDLERDAAMDLEAAKVLREQIAALAGDDPEFIRDTLEGECDIDQLLNQLVASERFDDALIDGAKEAKLRLDARVKTLEARKDRKRVLILTGMDILGIRRWDAPAGVVSLTDKRPGVDVIEEADIPARFWKKPDPVVDKKALNEAVLNRVAALEDARKLEPLEARLAALKQVDIDHPPVPGASVDNGGVTVTIRG